MRELDDVVYLAGCGAALLLSVVGLWFCALMPGVDARGRRFFRALFTVVALCGLCGFTETALRGDAAQLALFDLTVVLESVLLSLPYPMVSSYLMHCVGHDMRRSRLGRVVAVLWAAYLVLLAVSVFSDVFYVLPPDRQGHRSPWYSLMLMPMVAVALLNLGYAVAHRGRLSRKSLMSFLIALVPMAAMLVVFAFVESYALLEASNALCALSMYSLALSDQVECDLSRQREIARQESEIASQRASIMVLEMRPHFIYNTLTSVYCLCGQDPVRAKQVILDFTRYLRKNFNALSSSRPIPFSEELEHTRAYLAVEKAQYEDGLVVDFDTPHIRFRVPPLTLQPIVENAIKHGRDPYAGTFHVTIRTRLTEAGSQVEVIDDGRGFDAAEGDEPHLALENIRQRLEIMCGATMAIEAREGAGTKVSILVPTVARGGRP